MKIIKSEHIYHKYLGTHMQVVSALTSENKRKILKMDARCAERLPDSTKLNNTQTAGEFLTERKQNCFLCFLLPSNFTARQHDRIRRSVLWIW